MEENKNLSALQFERSQVICLKCHKVFKHFAFEKIDGIEQLLCGDVLITSTEMSCIHCGWVFRWGIRGRDLAKMAVAYGELMVTIKRYMPE